MKGTSFFSRSRRVAVCAEKLATWLDKNVAMPINFWSSCLSCGVGMLVMSSTLAGSIMTPLDVYVRPKKLMLVALIVHLEEFSIRPSFCATCMKRASRWSCCSSVSPYTVTSSLIPTTPSHCSVILSMCFWKRSWLTHRPKGSRVKQYLP